MALLKRFNKACTHDGIQTELKRRRFYSKPSERRREKHQAAVHRRIKNGLN